MAIGDNLLDIYITSGMITKNNFEKKVLQDSSSIEVLKYLQENQANIYTIAGDDFLDIYMPGMS